MDIHGVLNIAKRVALVSVILFASAFLTVLAIENQTPTVIGLWLFESTELPLVVWLAVAFLLGVLVASAIALYLHLRQSRHESKEQPDQQ